MRGVRRLAVGWIGWLVAIAMLAAEASATPEPMRIVSLAPSVTETVFALGLGDRLVGVSTFCDYPPAAEHVDRVGTFLTPNVEAIIAKRPDVVIAVPSPGNQDGVESLRRVGVKVVTLDPNTVEEIKRSLVTIARILGHEDRGRALVAAINERIDAVQGRLAGVTPRKVLMIVGQTPLVAVGPGTFQDELIRMAQGINLAAEAGSPWPHLSLEFVIAAAPQAIIDTTMGNEERAGAEAALAFWNAFPSIPAVRQRRVSGYKAYPLLRPGPRIAEAFEMIARFIHPERFEGAQATMRPSGGVMPAVLP